VQLHLIDLQLTRRLRHQRFHQSDALHAAGRTLRRSRRGIGQHGNASPAHGRRLVQQGDNAPGLVAIARLIVGSVIQ